MEAIVSIKPLLAILVSLTGGFLILLTGERSRNLRETWTILAAVTKCSIVLSMIPTILDGNVIEYTIISLAPGLLIQLRVDAFGLLFAILASCLWIATSFYSIGYMRGLNEHAQTRFFFCFAVALFATLGIAFSANLLTLFIFYETLTMATYPLVSHKETPDAIKGGRKYLTYTLTAGVVILLSLAIMYYFTGTLDFKPGGFIAGNVSEEMIKFLFITLVLGFGVKAGMMPFHEWLPTAMVAPTPVSALLHAVAVVKAGVFCVLRVLLYVFGPDLLHDTGLWLLLAYFVSFTIIVSCFFALAQDNIKRRLAFSTINNLSIIILGAALLSSSAIKGGMLHIAYHGFMKITLFFVAGAIYVKAHKQNVSELNGLGKQMPMTFGAFALGAMGVSGIPPLCGFISKWYLCLGSLEANEIFFLFVFLTSAFLDAAFFFPIIYRAFFKNPGEDVKPHFDEASMFMVVPLTATAVISLVLGIFPNALLPFLEIVNIAVKSIVGG